MAITLKEETILDEWSTIVDFAAGHADALLQDIQRRLAQAQIPGECHWSIEEVQSSTWFCRVRREFLVVSLEQFSDYRMYISARDYGIHLDIVRFLSLEQGWVERISDKEAAFSAPANILVLQDLKAWVTVVHRAVVQAVEELTQQLGQDPGQIRRESKGYLAVW